MSRLGRTPVVISKGVEVKVVDGVVHVKGPKGTLSEPMQQGLVLRIEEDLLFVDIEKEVEGALAFQGLQRALVRNMIDGVSKGFEKRLSLVGVGYRAAVQGQVLDLQLGFSHPTQMPIPQGIAVAVEKNTLVIISGSNKQAVGQFAASVRAIRPPEPYKGKGVRYENERVRKKDGKAAKGKTG